MKITMESKRIKVSQGKILTHEKNYSIDDHE